VANETQAGIGGFVVLWSAAAGDNIFYDGVFDGRFNGSRQRSKSICSNEAGSKFIAVSLKGAFNSFLNNEEIVEVMQFTLGASVCLGN